MGVTAYFYAATATIDQVEAALRHQYPEELRGVRADVRPDAQPTALEQIYKNDDGAVVVLWQDGRYTCWAESTVLLADEAALAALSEQLGTVLAAMIGEHGGSYAFVVCRNGEVVRWLQNDWELIGAAIPEEAGIEPKLLCDRDIETIWERFGLQPYYEGVPPFRALVATPDTRAADLPSPRSKSWWKFWR